MVSPKAAKLELKLRGVTLETLPFESFDVGLRLRSGSQAKALAQLFACQAPAPPPPEIRPGEVVPIEPPPERSPLPFALECDPPLQIRFVPVSSRGLLTALRNRFGGAGESPIRVVVVMEDDAAARLAAVVPPELRVLFSWAEAP